MTKRRKNELLDIGMNKASQSYSRIKIAAIAVDKKGRIIGRSCNNPRLDIQMGRKGAGLHAEQVLIKKFGGQIDTIYIVRIGSHNSEKYTLLPIDPCDKCLKVAKKFGIKIVSLS